MALLLTNNGSGASPGTTVSTAGSGGASGTPFDAVSIGTGETDTWDDTFNVLAGEHMMKFATAATVAANYVQWSTALGTLAVNQTLSGRLYYVTAGTPSTSIRLMQVLNGSTVLLTIYNDSGAGTISVHNSSGTLLGTATSGSLAAATLYRIEFVLGGIGTTSGTFTVNTYLGNSATLLGTSYTGSAAGFGSLAPNTVRYGLTTANGTASASYYLGSLQLDDSGSLPGPDTGAASGAAAPGATFFPRRMPIAV